MKRITISGIRDLCDDDLALVKQRIDQLCESHKHFVFGGARGTDTVALVAAGQHTVERLVILPGVLTQQPREAQEAIRKYATDVWELGLNLVDKQSYQTRNIKMLTEADELVAFWHGRSGGTKNCIKAAAQLKMPTTIVWVKGLVHHPRQGG